MPELCCAASMCRKGVLVLCSYELSPGVGKVSSRHARQSYRQARAQVVETLILIVTK